MLDGRWSWLGVMLVACGAAEPRQVATRSSAEGGAQPADQSQQLAEARRARAAALALTAPVVPANMSKDDALAFISGPLSEWLRARRALTEQAAATYASARVNAADELTAVLELGQLWQAFGDEFTRAGVATMPGEFASNEELATAYRGAIFDSARIPLNHAYVALQECVAIATRLGREPIRRECSERLARLPAAAKSAPDGDDSPPENGAESRLPERPKLAPSQPQPCVFAGSFGDSYIFDLWSEARSPVKVGSLTRLDLSSLVLPNREGDPVHVVARWPLQGEYRLDARTLAVVLRARQELVKDHVWLAAGTRVQALRPSAGRVQVSRPRAWSEGSSPTFARELPCAELGLVGSVAVDPEAEPKKRLPFGGSIALSSRPGGPPIARLQLSKAQSLAVLEQKPPWRRIAGNATELELPFSFDAWTKDAPGGEPELGMIGLFNPPHATHVSIGALAVFSAPDASAPVATLAPEVWLQATKTESGFVAVKITGLSRAEGRPFWVRESELAERARRVEP